MLLGLIQHTVNHQDFLLTNGIQIMERGYVRMIVIRVVRNVNYQIVVLLNITMRRHYAVQLVYKVNYTVQIIHWDRNQLVV